MEYIKIPKEISISDLLSNSYSLSSLNYTRVAIENSNNYQMRDLLDRELKSLDKGTEVGSQNYIAKSKYYFIRTKSLQADSFLPIFSYESAIPILPSAFKKMDLKKGDILISKDSNIGETVILDKDYPNYMMSGGIYKLPLEKNKYYVLNFLKSAFFKKQLHFMVSKGSTIRHAKTLFLNCKIPFPQQKNSEAIIHYVESLTQALINKEIAIKSKHGLIINSIQKELDSQQHLKNFKFEYPTLQDILILNRINAGIYAEKFKIYEYKIKNYKHGYKNIEQLGFNITRGQNLQISAIGKSLYSDEKKAGFYTLILPKNLSLFGTVKKYEYFGNSNKLKTLKSGDIIFGAEGFEKGRSVVIFENRDNTITNIHGVTLNHLDKNITLSIFVKCFLDYLRKIGMIDLYAVGGNGGSLAQSYWNSIPFPNFPLDIQKKIESMYYFIKSYPSLTSSDFLDKDINWNKEVGIVQLDESCQKIKHHLDSIINKIIKNEEVKIDYSFLI